MTDKISKEHRSWNMSRIRSKHSKPEKQVRSVLHRMGYRFRLHVTDIPGKPDIVLPKYQTIIFVHGCFWHRHKCKMGDRTPKSRVRFWREKLEANRRRDVSHRRKLRKMGWEILVVWECQTGRSKLDRLAGRIRAFLDA